MIYPIALPDRLELLVSVGDEQRQFTVPIPETRLRDEVQHFRELLEKRTTNEYLVPARQLYDQLIRPLEPLLAAHHIDTLVVVPDYTLRTIPFAALHDGKAFLMDRYATAIAPSMRLTDPRPLRHRVRHGSRARNFEKRSGLCRAAECRSRGGCGARNRGRRRAA